MGLIMTLSDPYCNNSSPVLSPSLQLSSSITECNGLLADVETTPSFPSFLPFRLLEHGLLWRHGISGRGPAWHTPDADAVPELHPRFPGAAEHQRVLVLTSLSPRPDP